VSLSASAPGPGEGVLQVGRAAAGSLAWAAADVTAVVEEARRRLDLAAAASAAARWRTAPAAGRNSTDRLVLEIRGDGPLRLVIAEADARQPARHGQSAQIDLPPSAGQDTSRQGHRQGLAAGASQDGASYRPGQLVTGRSAPIWRYLEQSEQTRSAVW
jgi:redox-regulated HSP33 family molecular chaperone